MIKSVDSKFDRLREVDEKYSGRPFTTLEELTDHLGPQTIQGGIWGLTSTAIPEIVAGRPLEGVQKYTKSGLGLYWTNDGALVTHPAAIVKIFKDQSGFFGRAQNVASSDFKKLGFLVGSSLLSTGQENPLLWSTSREHSKRALTPHKLNALVPEMFKTAEDWVAGLKDGQEIDILGEIKRHFSFPIMWKILMGEKSDTYGSIFECLSVVGHSSSDYLRPYRPAWFIGRGVSRASSRADELIAQAINDEKRRLSKMNSSSLPNDATLLTILALHQDLSPLEKVGTIRSMFLAGYDATAVSASWFLYLLGKNINEREIVYNEAQELPTGSGLTADHLKSLILAERAMSEAERLEPTIPVIIRAVLKDTEVLGCPLKRGQSVRMFFSSYRSPLIWEKPNDFTLNRWAGLTQLQHDSFSPFGIGMHACVGQHLAGRLKKILTLTLARRGCKLEYIPGKDAIAKPGIAREPRGNAIWMRVNKVRETD